MPTTTDSQALILAARSALGDRAEPWGGGASGIASCIYRTERAGVDDPVVIVTAAQDIALQADGRFALGAYPNEQASDDGAPADYGCGSIVIDDVDALPAEAERLLERATPKFDRAMWKSEDQDVTGAAIGPLSLTDTAAMVRDERYDPESLGTPFGYRPFWRRTYPAWVTLDAARRESERLGIALEEW